VLLVVDPPVVEPPVVEPVVVEPFPVDPLLADPLAVDPTVVLCPEDDGLEFPFDPLWLVALSEAVLVLSP
jgi:hypothetical protein